jgi:mannan endo-1,6-alpha-mannosidase
MWETRLNAFIAAAKTKFFDNGIIWEPACETNFNCDNDQFCFKGFLAQYMALATQLAPFTTAAVEPLLASSATAAAQYCDTGANGTMCTMWWTGAVGPATVGVGQQMSALNVFNANMVKFMDISVDTGNNGGTSEGNPNAGTPTSDQIEPYLPFFWELLILELHLLQLEIKYLLGY